MARVTVEDCLKNVRNRFELVIVAAKRARQIMRGGTPMVDIDNDKPTVIALREIAEGHTDFETHQTEEERETAAMLSSLNAASAAKSQEANAEATAEGAADAAAAAHAEPQPAAEQPTEQSAPETETPAETAQPEQAAPEQPAAGESQQPATSTGEEEADKQKSDQE